MALKLILVFLLIIFVWHSQASVQTVDLGQLNKDSLTPFQYAKLIADAQPQIVRKSVLHYINSQIPTLLRTRSATNTLQDIRKWFFTERIQQTSKKINQFMRARLFKKLQMDKLSESFRNQINAHPEDYFLTYDMYDLLIDQ